MNGMNTLLTSATVLADSFSLDKDTVTPGVMGFLAIFAIGVALFFLMRSMLGKMRGISTRAEEEREAEKARTSEAEVVTTDSTDSTDEGASSKG